MNRVFADTSFWFSLAVRADNNHQRTMALAEKLQESGTLLCVSDLIVCEAHRLLMHKLNINAGLNFLDLLFKQVDLRFVEILTVSEENLRQAKVLLFKYSDQDISLTDACSAVLMYQNHIEQIASYDRHFLVMGFQNLP